MRTARPLTHADLIARKPWLAARRTYLGASDLANLVGCGFADEHRVFRDKADPPDPDAPLHPLLRLGLELEPVVAARYEEGCGGGLAEWKDVARHPGLPFLAANPDRHDPSAVGCTHLVELKTTAHFGDDWGPTGSAVVPEKYTIQATCQMGCVGAVAGEGIDRMTLAALCRSTGEFRWYAIPFDPDLFGLLAEVAGRAWRDHIEPRVPFPPEWAERYGGAARARAVRRGAVAELPPAAAGLVRRRQELKAVQAEAEAEADRLTAAIDALMGECETARVPGFTVRRVHNPGGPVPATVRRPYTYLTVRPDRKEARQ